MKDTRKNMVSTIGIKLPLKISSVDLRCVVPLFMSCIFSTIRESFLHFENVLLIQTTLGFMRNPFYRRAFKLEHIRAHSSPWHTVLSPKNPQGYNGYIGLHQFQLPGGKLDQKRLNSQCSCHVKRNVFKDLIHSFTQRYLDDDCTLMNKERARNTRDG